MTTLTPLRFLVGGAVALALLAACGGGGGGDLTRRESRTAGAFKVLATNLEPGSIWELNRPIRIEFNHPIDPASIGFSSVVIRPASAEILGHPVTGSFELEPGSDGRVLVFRPTCPTNDTNDNGAFVPGGYRYELMLPTQAQLGSSVLRDTGGHALSVGLQRFFYSPRPPAQALFLDTSPEPPRIVAVTWPAGLNFFTAPDPLVSIDFDQPIDGRSSNLNTARLYLLYSDGEVGTPGENSFPETNRLPGQLLLGANCTATGARVHFRISGLLPPNRKLRVILENSFRDIAGQTNVSRIVWSPDHQTPTLASIYNDPTWNEASDTVDEFQDGFETTRNLAGSDVLVLPPATVENGVVAASFDFPGRFVAEDADVLVNDTLEIYTDGQTIFTDSLGRPFTVSNGVLYCDDFTINGGKTLRGRGRNPLVIYATGDVRIDGTLDVSGNHSHWPTGINTPQFPEGGALGECGGGAGGTSSQVTNAETPRGEAGDGPFNLLFGGGGGGEGGFQQNEFLTSGGQDYKDPRIIAGGGAGGTFAMTPNAAIIWDNWKAPVEIPQGLDNQGPDHYAPRHPLFDVTKVYGGEHGMRGSSFESKGPTLPTPGINGPVGIYGMEDERVDTVAYDGDQNTPGNLVDWKAGWIDPPYDGAPIANNNQEPVGAWWGHPTDGPDPGLTNASPFSFDPGDPTGSLLNDFWGARINSDGSVTAGELLAPWAGYGGGASGDVQILRRYDSVSGTYVPLPTKFPDRPFLTETTWYYKGAPGGGGGGQLLLMAIGSITIGPAGFIKSNGGIGHGGESDIYTYNQVSGGGGGSGGHVVLHSATKIDLSLIYVGVATTAAQVANLSLNEPPVQAIGGRRGWCMSQLTTLPGSGTKDGNPTFMIGRGGAGGNGVVQLHVQDPGTDIIWHSQARTGINLYIRNNNVNNPVDTSKLEDVLAIYCAPRPYALIPFFGSGSQVQSVWIDTGLAYLRKDPANGGSYPDWASALLRFTGVGASGDVQRSGTRVTPQAEVATGAAGEASFSSFEVRIPSASTRFAAHFLRTPGLLVGYDVLPNAANTSKNFEVVGSTYDRPSDVLTLATRSTDGAMTLALGPTWSVRQRFFRVDTSGLKDYLPGSSNVRFEFQGTDDPDNPAAIVPGPTAWTANLALLKGKRFIRYRLSFDIDSNNQGVTLSNPRPAVDYVKIPFVW